MCAYHKVYVKHYFTYLVTTLSGSNIPQAEAETLNVVFTLCCDFKRYTDECTDNIEHGVPLCCFLNMAPHMLCNFVSYDGSKLVCITTGNLK